MESLHKSQKKPRYRLIAEYMNGDIRVLDNDDDSEILIAANRFARCPEKIDETSPRDALLIGLISAQINDKKIRLGLNHLKQQKTDQKNCKPK